jgi:hypothetical protein
MKAKQELFICTDCFSALEMETAQSSKRQWHHIPDDNNHQQETKESNKGEVVPVHNHHVMVMYAEWNCHSMHS